MINLQAVNDFAKALSNASLTSSEESFDNEAGLSTSKANKFKKIRTKSSECCEIFIVQLTYIFGLKFNLHAFG